MRAGAEIVFIVTCSRHSRITFVDRLAGLSTLEPFGTFMIAAYQLIGSRLLMDFSAMVADAIGYTRDALWGKWVKWLVLALYTPINLGYYRHILQGEAEPPARIPDTEEVFIEGLKLLLVLAVYALPVFVIAFAFFGGTYALLSTMILTGDASAAIAILGTVVLGSLITFLLSILVGLIAAIAAIRFSRTADYAEAFNFGAILDHIARIGWGNYIVSFLIPVLVIGIVVLGLLLIPLIGWALLVILGPVFGIFLSRYLASLYDAAAV